MRCITARAMKPPKKSEKMAMTFRSRAICFLLKIFGSDIRSHQKPVIRTADGAGSTSSN